MADAGARKDDHLRLAAAQQRQDRQRGAFDDVEIVHHALSGVDPRTVTLETRIAQRAWPAPLYVNGMTGGTETTGAVNRSLAIAAREANLPIASGSMSIALDDPSRMPTFRVLRDEHPHGIVLANLGAGRSADDARRAVDALEADALQIHLNAAQELVMPEGRARLGTWRDSIAAMREAVDVPVIVKEVGAGLSRRTLLQLRDLGVQVADVGGTGGTDFVRVENDRRHEGDFGYLAGWGQSTPACLLDAPPDGPQLLASGGVRSPFDVVRALALGASAVGVAGAFLRIAVDDGEDAIVHAMRTWRTHLGTLMALVGASTPAALGTIDLLVHGRLREHAELLGVDVAALARRSTTNHDEESR